MSQNDAKVVDQPADITNLQESFNKQQAKISALKELVRKSELAHGKSTSSAQEKVKNINDRLNKIKDKARSRQNLDECVTDSAPICDESPNVSIGIVNVSTPVSQMSRTRSETPGSEKFQLLRKQMEQNKLKMVERENSKREIEEMVTQLKAKFDSTQQSLEHSSEIGRSMGDLSALSYTPVKDKIKSATDLTYAPLNLDKERIKYLDNRIRLLEKQLEKEKNLHQPKDESESEQLITQLQLKIAKLEKNLKDLASDDSLTLRDLDEKIVQIRQATDLEKTNKELQNRILELEQKIKDDTVTSIETDLDLNEELNINNKKLKDQLEEDKSLSEMENQKFEIVSKDELTTDNSEDITQKISEEYVEQIQTLNDKIRELENDNDELKKLTHESQDIKVSDENVADVIKTLEATIETQREEIQKQADIIKNMEEKLTEKTIELNVLNANFSVLQEKLKSSAPKSLFTQSSDEESEVIINKLKTQLDDANKSMIKIKLKSKQLQKQIDSFKKSSNINASLVKAMDDNEKLQQRITELENELQLSQFNVVSTSDVVLSDEKIEEKLQILETTCQNQNSAIQLLEEQKLDMTEHLQTAKNELESLKDQFHEINKDDTARVASEMESIQLEEQVYVNRSQINELSKENNELKSELLHLKNEKEELTKKIDHYVAENMELLDKIEQLSKSSSSAESIEIVENLTQQERQEIDDYNRRLIQDTEQHKDVEKIKTEQPEVTGTMGQELSESLVQLREESSELMHKIELFTTERREVLEKMEKLSAENQDNLNIIEKLKLEKNAAEKKLFDLESTHSSLEEKCENLNKRNSRLNTEMGELMESKDETNTQLKNLTLQLNQNVDFISSEDNKMMLEKCENSLAKLYTELEAFRKANDKNNKINASKKLAKEAKNTHQMVSEFLEKLKSGTVSNNSVELSDKCNTLEATIISLQKELEENHLANEELFSECQSKSDQISILTNKVEILQHAKMNHEQNLIQFRKEHELKVETMNNEIKLKIDELKQKNQRINELQKQLKEFNDQSKANNEKSISNFQKELEKLENLLSSNKNLLAEQAIELSNKQVTIDSLNGQIMDLYKTMEENANKVIEKDDEIIYLQELLDNNKVEMDRLKKESDDQKILAEKLLIELHSHRASLGDSERIQFLENRVQELEKSIIDSDTKSKDQLEKLKKYAANLKKKVIQCKEYEKKLREIETKLNQTTTVELETKIKTLEDLHRRDQRRYHEELGSLQSENELLFNEREAVQDKLKKTLAELDKIKEQNQSTVPVEKFEYEISEKSQLLKTLKHQFGLVTIELENSQTLCESLREQVAESAKLEEKLKECESLNEKLTEDLKAKNVKFEKCKAVLKEKIREIQRITKEKEELEQQPVRQQVEAVVTIVPEESSMNYFEKEFKDLQQQHSLLQEQIKIERAGFKETVSRLEMLHDGIQAKLQEDMSYIESLEIDNNKFKEKICRLEECVASFEERRSSLERRANLLDAQLHSKTEEFEKSEDALVYRLNMLSDHDDIIGQRLLQTQEEKEELSDKLDRLRVEHSELLVNFTKLEKELTTLQTDTNNSLETENQSLREQLATVEKDLNKIHANHNAALAKKNAEIDELENDLSEQLSNVEKQKRYLQEQLERTQDEVKALNDEIVKQKESLNSIEQAKNELEREMTWIKMQNENLCQDQFELHELRMQTMQDKNELENLKHQYDSLLQNHDFELNALRLQISELDHLRSQVGQNQTDDQVFVQTENIRLKDLLAEKEATIESYQRQNLQLQMSSMNFGSTANTTSAPTTGDSFLALGSTSQPDDTFEITRLKEKCEKLENDLSELKSTLQIKNEEILQLQTTHAAILESKPDDLIEIETLTEKSLKLEKELAELKQTSSAKINESLNDLNEMQKLYSAAIQTNSENGKNIAELQLTLNEKNEQITQLTIELNNLQAENKSLQGAIVAENERRNKIVELEKELAELHSSFELKIEENSKITNDFRNLQNEFNRIHDVDPFSTVGISTANDKCERLEIELAELHTSLHNRNQQYESLTSYLEKLTDQMKEQEMTLRSSQIQCQQLSSDLQSLQFEFNQILVGNAEMQKQNLAKQQELDTLKNELSKCKNQKTAPVNVATAPLFTAPVPSASSFFDEIIIPKSVEKLATPISAQLNEQQIDDLQLIVKNLETNSTELENKLRSLTIEHENALRQLNENKILYENSIKMYEEKLKILEDKTKEFDVQKSIESQILPAPSLNMFFSGPSVSDTHFEPTRMEVQQSFETPVVEEVIVPKKSYVCQPDSGPITALDLGGNDWDGGWGVEEAVLEEKHQKTTAMPVSLFTPSEQTDMKLKDCQNRIMELELERDRLEEQKQEMLLKTNKLMKKLKEYKNKLDEANSMQSSFRKSSSIESSNDLDLAIQEELKSQVKQLEEKLSDLKKNTEKDTVERENLLKRIDVLTAANDRMTEMKERQDADLSMYKSRIRELDEKLKNLEDWGGDETVNSQKEIKQKDEHVDSSLVISQQDLQNQIANLSAELNDLKIDRDELQALLDEEKINVDRAESKIHSLQEKLLSLEDVQTNKSNAYESEFNDIQIENQNLKIKLNEFELNIERSSSELRSVKLALDSLTRDYENKCEELAKLERQNQDLLVQNQQLTNDIEKNKWDLINNNKKCDQLEKLLQERESAVCNLTQLEKQNQDLHVQNQHLTNDIEKYKLDSINNKKCDQLEELLQEKASEILHLNQKIDDLQHEDQTEKLVLEILAKNQEIHMLKIQVRNLTEERNDLENNLSLQLTKEMSNRHTESSNDNLQKKIDELETTINHMNEEKKQMEEELSVLNNHVLSTLDLEEKTKQAMFELNVKNIEIVELKKSLELAKTQLKTESQSKSVIAPTSGNAENIDIDQINAQWERIVDQKCNEIAESWRAHLEQTQSEHNEIENRLRQQIENVENPERITIESTTLESESSSESKTESGDNSDAELIQKMQSALENQEMEIVTLKEQLAIRSAEYAQIAAQYDPYQMKKSFGSNSLDSNTQRRSASTGESSVVPKSELDLALYMLHQRDMRCEEITLELVHLLEERDTLQLKLSNTIRQVEDIKQKTGWNEAHESPQLSPDGTKNSNNPPTLNTDEIDSKKNTDELNVKISQLQSVSHSKDKNYQEEREQHIRQMTKIHQDVAKIPSQAVENLVGADLSQSEQSPSSVLLNWLWGKPNTNQQQS